MKRTFTTLIFLSIIFTAATKCGRGDAELTTGGASILGLQDQGSNNARPTIYNYSASSEDQVFNLVRKAIDGMGFSDRTGPNSNDIFFVNKSLMAWVDQTGSYGKVNGLWRMNDENGDRLDFVLKENGRPVNTLIPGEDGNGHWPSAYSGGEHIEFQGHYQDQEWYSLNEAYQLTYASWWMICNDAAIPWDKKIEPIVHEASKDGVKLVYEGLLVQRGGHSGVSKDCGKNFRFPDGVRRAVYLRVGIEFYADTNYIGRTIQVRNPEGNPTFYGPGGFVGGFILSRWPNPHPLKAFSNYVRPEIRDARSMWEGKTFIMLGNQWNPLFNFPISRKDIVLGWANQPLSLSVGSDYLPGQAITLDHNGPSDNRNTGFCLCYGLGGIEVGGGLINSGDYNESSMPIGGGMISIEARRVLILH